MQSRLCNALVVATVLALVFLAPGCAPRGARTGAPNTGAVANNPSPAASGTSEAAPPKNPSTVVQNNDASGDQDMFIPGDAKTYRTKEEITDKNLFLTTALKGVYDRYASQKNIQELQGLSPIDVFRLYNHAEDIGDLETQVALINLPPEITPAQLLKEIGEDQAGQANTKQEIAQYKQFTGKIYQIIVNDGKAYIVLEKYGYYRFERVGQGVWKLGWLARQ